MKVATLGFLEAPDPLTRRCARRRGENASAEVGILFPIGWLCHLNGDADTRRADDVETGGRPANHRRRTLHDAGRDDVDVGNFPCYYITLSIGMSANQYVHSMRWMSDARAGDWCP